MGPRSSLPGDSLRTTGDMRNPPPVAPAGSDPASAAFQATANPSQLESHASGYPDLHRASSGPKPDGSLPTLYPGYEGRAATDTTRGQDSSVPYFAPGEDSNPRLPSRLDGKIRTCGLHVPNVACYQTAPHLDKLYLLG